MIHLQDINKTYFGAQPLHVLKGISLDIEKGEFVSIMGASGSGKSTLLNILGILDNYDSGSYELAGTPIWNLSETKAAEYRNKMIGFIFQSFNLISFKTAVENVELPLFYQGVSRKKRHELALDYLDRLGLLAGDRETAPVRALCLLCGQRPLPVRRQDGRVHPGPRPLHHGPPPGQGGGHHRRRPVQRSSLIICL